MNRIAIALVVLLLAACAMQSRGRSSDNADVPYRQPTPAMSTPQPTPLPPRVPDAEPVPTVTASAPRVLPAFDHEPVIGILIARAPNVVITLDRPSRIVAGGVELPVGAGMLTVQGRAGGWLVSGSTRLITGDGVLAATSVGSPSFTVDAIPAFGKGERLQLTGDVLIHPVNGEVEIIERLPMETYLASVVAREMNPSWPSKALAAQAIVARSYAAARWVERSQNPWQLHWHFGVDMAYGGWRKDLVTVAAAIAPTRGEVLIYRGFPILALFHASSGGRTESFSRVKPNVMGPDGRTDISGSMPIVEDPAAIPGAAGLKLSDTHAQWKADIPLPDLTRSLQVWSAKARGRPRFGDIEGVSVIDRNADSGRVNTVSIRHVLDGKRTFTTLAAPDFRLAAGPGTVRSTWWDRCVIAARAPGYLVLEGRGFGHGCGLSQVSAWYLAKQGQSPEAIVHSFYAGAKIERRY